MTSISDKIIRRSHFVERYKTQVANQFDPYLREIDKAVRDALSKSERIRSSKQLFSIQRRLRLQILDIYKEWNKSFNKEIIDFGAAEVNFLVKAAGSIGAVSTPTRNELKAAIYTRPFQTTLLRESLSDLARSDAKRLKNAIAQGYYAGQSNADIVREIRGTKANNFQDGILRLSKVRTDRLVRTAVNHTSARAKEAFYSENSDIIKRYQWKATLDSRTSDICRGRHNQVWEVGKGPLPPAHFNCRSTTVPYL